MAEMSGEININILFPNGEGGNVSTNSENGNPAAPVNVGQPNADNPAASGSKSVSVAAGVNVAMSLGKQAMGAVVSNIGLATGNNYAQARVQGIISGVGTMAGLAMAASNPVTLAASIGALAISAGTQIWQEVQNRKWDNRRAEQCAVMYGFAGENGR